MLCITGIIILDIKQTVTLGVINFLHLLPHIGTVGLLLFLMISRPIYIGIDTALIWAKAMGVLGRYLFKSVRIISCHDLLSIRNTAVNCNRF
jgi:hypothetical protein